ncbi:MAG TPA: NAD(P)H-hydrate epimerase [Hadesarchaea archaeon]|nr:NAD(P)H-hydrate epimerase [Hadesarchaea archaeon]
MKPVAPEEMRDIEKRAEEMGVSRLQMMESAGKAVADCINAKIELKGKRIAVICGMGNNGGDGFVAARYLASYGAIVTVFLLGNGEKIKSCEASRNWEIINRMKKTIKVVQLASENLERWSLAISSADVIVDAIFGTGIKGELGDPYVSLMELINSSEAMKVSVDVPSGLNPSTGRYTKTVVADVTVTFHRKKKGMMSQEHITGEVIVANIGIPPEADTYGP